jgi:hypothetical protein
MDIQLGKIILILILTFFIITHLKEARRFKEFDSISSKHYFWVFMNVVLCIGILFVPDL